MVAFARNYSGAKIFKQTFSAINSTDKFDGLWAYATLLHFSANVFEDIVTRLYLALKPTSPFYMSFKYGKKVYERDKRLFQYNTEDSLENILVAIGFIKKNEMWVTQDI